MSKKIILSLIGVSIIGVGAYAGNVKYQQGVETNLNKISEAFQQNQMNLSYKNVESSLFSPDIIVHGISINKLNESKEIVGEAIELESLKINRDVFKEEGKLPKKLDFSIKGLSSKELNNPMLKNPIKIDFDYAYEYNVSQNTYNDNMFVDVPHYFSFSSDYTFSNVENLWKRAEKSFSEALLKGNFDLEKNLFPDVETEEEFKKEMGDLSVNNFNVKFEEKGILDLLLNVGVMMGAAPDVNSLKNQGIEFINQDPNIPQEMKGDFINFITKGGVLEFDMSPEKPVHLVNFIEQADKDFEVLKSEKERSDYFISKFNASFKYHEAKK
jgi:hypothetical protein